MTDKEIKDLKYQLTEDEVSDLSYGYFKMATVKALLEENELLKKKLNKAIELLIEYNIPCEMNDFMNKNVDYCSSNCGVDEEVYKKCWLRYIEQELEK